MSAKMRFAMLVENGKMRKYLGEKLENCFSYACWKKIGGLNKGKMLLGCFDERGWRVRKNWKFGWKNLFMLLEKYFCDFGGFGVKWYAVRKTKVEKWEKTWVWACSPPYGWGTVENRQGHP